MRRPLCSLSEVFPSVRSVLKHVLLLQPLHVVCPEQYTQPPLTQSHRSDLMLELQPPPMPYRRCSVLNLPFRRRYERVYILPEVSKQTGAGRFGWLWFN